MTIRNRSCDRFRRLVALLAVAAACTLTSTAARAQGTHDIWTTDGAVYAMARSGNTLYIGGYFGRVGPTTGSALLYDPTSAQPLLPPPSVAAP